jgi:bifunctional UDP-N-acetylglucosamine pyrophosphorylase/glucosamine-1-phosphate N-acetyltransferase
VRSSPPIRYDVAGINSRGELAMMEAEWQKRRRKEAMDAGVTLIAPETVWFAMTRSWAAMS